MQDLTGKVRAALEEYLKRGHEALQALASRQAEEFFQIMARRDAAFHNFCALDALAEQAGVDAAADGHIRRLWIEIDQVNRTLKGRMTEVQTDLGERLAKLRRGSARTQAYHSGTPQVLRLVKTV